MPSPNYTSAQLVDRGPIEYPIPRDRTAQVFTEQYVVNTANYDPPDLDDAHPDSSAFSDFICVDVQGVRLTEDHTFYEVTWATIPADRDDPLDYTFTFPGYIFTAVERTPPTLGVPARLTYEYILNPKPAYRRFAGATAEADNDTISLTDHPFADGDKINFEEGTGFTGLTTGTDYYARDVVAGVSFKVAATKGGSAIDITVDGSDGVFSRGIAPRERQTFTNEYGEVSYLNDGGGSLIATTPTLTTYKGWVTARTEFIAEDSEIVHYMGNIWARRTIRIEAR